MNLQTIIIAGPTASGKTDVAYLISKKFPSTIINADSMQVYKDFSILTNRPSEKETKTHNCKIFGELSLNKKSNFGWWIKRAKEEIVKSRSVGKIPIVVGGTGLYLSGLEKEISAIPPIREKVKKKIQELHKKKGNQFFFRKLQSIDSEIAQKLHQNDTQRILRAVAVKISTGKNLSYWQKKKKGLVDNKNHMYVVIKTNRNCLYNNINKRFLKMIEKGAINEVKRFMALNIKSDHPINKIIGLRYLISYVEKKITIKDAIMLAQKDTRNFAKRQITWFKHQPINAHYFDKEEAHNFLVNFIKKKNKF